MGEYTDLVLDGVLDMYTGEYLGDACGYPRSLEDEQEHERETKKSKYACGVCDKNFTTWKGRMMHMEHKHSRKEKTHKCNVCGTMCRGQDALEQHMRDKGCK